jgi:hypothetical protein
MNSTQDNKRQRLLPVAPVASDDPVILSAFPQQKGKNGQGHLELAVACAGETPPIMVGWRGTSGQIKHKPWMNGREVVALVFVAVFSTPNPESFRDVFDWAQDPSPHRKYGYLDVSEIVSTVTVEEFGAEVLTLKTLQAFLRSNMSGEMSAVKRFTLYSNMTKAGQVYTTNSPEKVFSIAPEGVPLLDNFRDGDAQVKMADVGEGIKYLPLISLESMISNFNAIVMEYHPQTELTVSRVTEYMRRLLPQLTVAPEETEKQVLARLAKFLSSDVLFPFRRPEFLRKLQISKICPPNMRDSVKLKNTTAAMTFLLATMFVIPSIREVFEELKSELYGMSNQRKETGSEASGKKKRKTTKVRTSDDPKDMSDYDLASVIIKLLTQVFSSATGTSPVAFQTVFGAVRKTINDQMNVAAERRMCGQTSEFDGGITAKEARWYVAEQMRQETRGDPEAFLARAKEHPIQFVRPEDVATASKINPLAGKSAASEARRALKTSASELSHLVEVVDQEADDAAEVLRQILDSCETDGLSSADAGQRAMLAVLDLLNQRPKIAGLTARKIRDKVAESRPLPHPTPRLLEISRSRDFAKPGFVVGRVEDDRRGTEYAPPVHEHRPPVPIPMEIASTVHPAAPPVPSNGDLQWGGGELGMLNSDLWKHDLLGAPLSPGIPPVPVDFDGIVSPMHLSGGLFSSNV